MCEPTLILAIAAGGAQTFLQTRQQDAAWEAEVAAVDRSNVMAHQNYQNQLNIAVRDDENKGNIFFAELGRAATERSNYWKQKLINQIEETRATQALALEKKEAIDEAELKGQQALVAKIQAQGEVLASGMQPGKSLMLEFAQQERALGFATAEINSKLYNAEQGYAMKQAEIGLGKYGADVAAYNALRGGPTMAPDAAMAPGSPMEIERPSRPSMLGPILSGIMTGISVYGSAGALRGGGTGPLGNTLSTHTTTYAGGGFAGQIAGRSDIRLKENIVKIGKALSGLNIYEWNYKSAPNTRYRGVIAQEVIKVVPEAVVKDNDGFLSVIYDLLDVNMEIVT